MKVYTHPVFVAAASGFKGPQKQKTSYYSINKQPDATIVPAT